MVLKRAVLSTFSFLVAAVIIFCITLNAYAAPRVVSTSWPWCNKCKLNVFHKKGKCSGGGTLGIDPIHYNLFRIGNDVYAKGIGLNTSSPYIVDIYVVPDQDWTLGDRFGPGNPLDPQDVTPDGVEQVIVGQSGILKCTKIWGKPLVPGNYDIIVDADQDGTYDPSIDAIDGEQGEVGFKVK